MFILKWTNKYSGETGYVESISSKSKCFINTFDEKTAKRYANRIVAERMLASLKSYGEADNNNFDIIEAVGA